MISEVGYGRESPEITAVISAWLVGVRGGSGDDGADQRGLGVSERGARAEGDGDGSGAGARRGQMRVRALTGRAGGGATPRISFQLQARRLSLVSSPARGGRGEGRTGTA